MRVDGRQVFDIRDTRLGLRHRGAAVGTGRKGYVNLGVDVGRHRAGASRMTGRPAGAPGRAAPFFRLEPERRGRPRGGCLQFVDPLLQAPIPIRQVADLRFQRDHPRLQLLDQRRLLLDQGRLTHKELDEPVGFLTMDLQGGAQCGGVGHCA